MAEHTINWGRRWHQLMAILMLVNLALVGFNLSYVTLRGLYLRYTPALVHFYDPVLGIEPQPLTQTYLRTVDQLTDSVAQTGLESTSTQELLIELRSQSHLLISENPYLVSNQMPVFAKLKRRLRGHMETSAAEEALARFWQADYLAETGWEPAIGFFQGRIRPLLERNFYREINEMGQYVDEFWRIDSIFMVIFGVELLGRTYGSSRRRSGVSWGDAIARQWYELPLVLPLGRWLRILPTTVKLHHSGLFNLEKLLAQITHEPAAYLSDRVSKFVLVRFVNQTQQNIKTGDFGGLWQAPQGGTAAADSKFDRLSDRLIQLAIYQALPTVKPDLQELLHHSLKGALTRNEIYGGLKQIPGLNAMPSDALDGLSTYLAQATCDVLAESYADEEGRVIIEQLSQNFRAALGQGLQDKQTSAEVRQLLNGLLEEFKYKYIQQAEYQDPETILEEANQLFEQSSELSPS
ncbi:MAG: hypothetical protein EA342_01170 [Leptolyngbya sp. LCM1.Bin17]|nr:MAG: hypothetical protein EA342_01170 [Leptolyngbya sp. LCM1.Bin17]